MTPLNVEFDRARLFLWRISALLRKVYSFDGRGGLVCEKLWLVLVDENCDDEFDHDEQTGLKSAW